MLPTVDHPRLKRSAVEARAYQLEGVAEALECSTLLVYPTAAGKTAVSAMVVAEVISDGGRVVMLAPTVGLVEQHKSTLKNWLTGDVYKRQSQHLLELRQGKRGSHSGIHQW